MVLQTVRISKSLPSVITYIPRYAIHKYKSCASRRRALLKTLSDDRIDVIRIQAMTELTLLLVQQKRTILLIAIWTRGADSKTSEIRDLDSKLWLLYFIFARLLINISRQLQPSYPVVLYRRPAYFDVCILCRY